VEQSGKEKMFLKQLVIRNFRCYETLAVGLMPGINVFYGDNGTGKTNILEAVYCISSGKSFRTADDSVLIRHNNKSFSLIAEVSDNNLDKKLTYEYNSEVKRKTYRENSSRVTKIADMIGKLPVVLFSPENIMTVKGEPALRRKLIDEFLFQINKEHYITSVKYAKEVSHRNYILKGIREGKIKSSNLEIWNSQIAENGTKIIIERLNAVKTLNKILSGKLFVEKAEISLRYLCRQIEIHDEEKIRKNFEENLDKNLNEEIARATTLCGPHRDDIQITYNGLGAKEFASEGQQRITAIMIKLSEGLAIVEKCGSFPVVLLDDFSSELDDINRGLIGKTFKLFKQILITTTHRENLKGFSPAMEFVVSGGKLEKC